MWPGRLDVAGPYREAERRARVLPHLRLWRRLVRAEQAEKPPKLRTPSLRLVLKPFPRSLLPHTLSYKVPFSVRVEAYQCANADRYWAELDAELEPKRTQQLRADAERAAKRAAGGPQPPAKRTRGAESPDEGSAASGLLGKQRARRARPFFGARGGVSARHAKSPRPGPVPKDAGSDEDEVTTAVQPTTEPDRAGPRTLSSSSDVTSYASPPSAALAKDMQPLRVLSILAAAELPSQNAVSAVKSHAAPLSTAFAPPPAATAAPPGTAVAPRPAATALPPETPVESPPTMALPPGTPPAEDTTDSTTSTISIPTVRAGQATSAPLLAEPAIQPDINPAVGVVTSGAPSLHTAAPPSVSVVLHEALNDVDAQLNARVKYLNQLVRVRREMTALVRLLAATSQERGGRLPVPVPEGAAYTLHGARPVQSNPIQAHRRGVSLVAG